VDDEPTIVKIQRQRLERMGYHVESTQSSVEALEIFRRKPEAFDLVITDMTMPAMTGDLLAREIKALRPELPVLLCTGFNERLGASPEGLAVDTILMKPVDRPEFAVAVRAALDTAGTRK
jgi:CheY-like chemotaxis protein